MSLMSVGFTALGKLATDIGKPIKGIKCEKFLYQARARSEDLCFYGTLSIKFFSPLTFNATYIYFNVLQEHLLTNNSSLH